MGRTTLRTLLVAVVLAGTAAMTPWAFANHMSDWTHDHSRRGVPPRPDGYRALVRTFGPACNGSANDARSYWPSQAARGVPGYVYVNTYIGRNVSYNVRNHIEAAHRNGAVDYGVYGYACRYISGTTSWSTHAFGAAVDTNSARNPVGQDHWDGHGADGVNHRRYLPKVWAGGYPGHRFYWGLHFNSTPDPMHFQYVTGY